MWNFALPAKIHSLDVRTNMAFKALVAGKESGTRMQKRRKTFGRRWDLMPVNFFRSRSLENLVYVESLMRKWKSVEPIGR